MSDNGVFLSISEYDRLRSLDARVALLQSELCAVKSELAEAHAHLRPIHSRIDSPLSIETPHLSSSGELHFLQPVTFLQGPIARGIVCRNCGCDMWLVDDIGDPMCGSCGLYVKNGIKVVDVKR